MHSRAALTQAPSEGVKFCVEGSQGGFCETPGTSLGPRVANVDVCVRWCCIQQLIHRQHINRDDQQYRPMLNPGVAAGAGTIDSTEPGAPPCTQTCTHAYMFIKICMYKCMHTCLHDHTQYVDTYLRMCACAHIGTCGDPVRLL